MSVTKDDASKVVDTKSDVKEDIPKESPMKGLLTGKKTFVGWVMARIVDEDGIPRKTKGHSVCTSLRHIVSTEEGKERTFIAELSLTNPIKYLGVMNRGDILILEWFAGKVADKIPGNTVLATATIPCNKIEEDCEASETGDCNTSADIYFVADRYSKEKQASLTIHTECLRLNRRVTRIEMKMSETCFEEWLEYFIALSEWDKKDDEKKDDKKDDEKKDGEESKDESKAE